MKSHLLLHSVGPVTVARIANLLHHIHKNQKENRAEGEKREKK